MPSEERHEGLVLRSIDFRDRQKILTLFTPTMGMISLIVKGINRKKSHLLTLTSPFTRGEYLFRISRSDLYTFQDGTPLATNNSLRENLNHIEAAILLSKALLKSQMPEKPAPALYKLTTTYLEHLPTFDDPTPLTASFLLKLLKHEGHLALDHVSPSFTQNDWKVVSILSELRTIKKLKETSVSSSLHDKITSLFEKSL